MRDLPEVLRATAHGVEERPAATGETIQIRLDRPLEESVDAILGAALALEDGNRSRAARRLGVSLRTMQRFASRHAPRWRGRGHPQSAAMSK